MKLLSVLWRLKPIGIWNLLVLCAKHPTFVRPTIKATKTSLAISSHHFGEKHHLDGQANAFRHALWNFLIAKQLEHKKLERVLSWTKAITDWHELAFPNQDIARLMDTHNNEIGRNLYVAHADKSIGQITQQILHMAQNAQVLHDDDSNSLPTEKLVYLKT